MVSLSLHSALSGVPASVLEGALVLLPRAKPFPRLARLRAPAWAALLPVSIIVGTFGLLIAPGLASSTVLVAAITAPLLAGIAVLLVVRARPVMLPLAAFAGALAVWAGGMGGHIGTGVVTALACLTVGAGLQRLIPGRWLLVGVVAMSAVDITLLLAGPGYHETAVLAAAQTNFHGPRFTGAHLGGTTIGYPDLFLAALMGASLAGQRAQVWAAALLTGLAIAYDSLLTPGLLLPATVPIALTLVVVGVVRQRRRSPRAMAPPAAMPAPAVAAEIPCGPASLLSDARAPRARTARRTCPQHA
ncbi:MAG TPA: hypothetical protein VGG07_13160 [Solirubrobacteraceae bacterium]|jgi:hypothetical protein